MLNSKKKIITIFLLFLLLLSIIAFIINNNENNKDNYSMVIVIKNRLDKNENIKIIVFNNLNNEIFNKSFLIEANEYFPIRNITNEIGTYYISVYIDNNRTIENNKVNIRNNYGTIHIEIQNDRIDFHQEQK